MYIAQNLRRLRLEKGLTQEELAQRVGVTGQAVSKWERDECYPDITLLPGLANCFDVMVDELLGMAEIKGKIWGAYAQATTLQKAGRYYDAASVFDEALKTFPADLGLSAARAEALAMAGEDLDKAIELHERLLSGDMSEKRRASVAAVLCFLYRSAGKTDKAELLTRSRPHARESREFLLPNFLGKPRRDAYLRENLPGILTAICSLIDGNEETDAEMIRRIALGTYRVLMDPADAAQKISTFFKANPSPIRA